MPAIDFASVSHSYDGVNLALSEITLSIQQGERIGLVGPSGSGKSTLLRTINGLVVPTTGQANILGIQPGSASESDRVQLRRQTAMIFQEFALIDRLTVLANVLVGRLGYNHNLSSLFRLFPAADIELAKTAIAEVGLSGFEEREVRRLSGGQKQRVGIARALAQQGSIIVADEPTANLDVRTTDETLSLLLNLSQNRNVALVLSLHDVRAARKYCDRIVALRAGRKVFDGAAAAFGDEEVEKVFYNG